MNDSLEIHRRMNIFFSEKGMFIFSSGNPAFRQLSWVIMNNYFSKNKLFIKTGHFDEQSFFQKINMHFPAISGAPDPIIPLKNAHSSFSILNVQ